jgi:hypothetical protein
MRSEDTQPADEEPHEDEEFVSALVLTPRAPFLAWVAAQAPGEPPRDPVVVLTPELPTPADRDTWLEQHHAAVFAAQLGAWDTDESGWPADRSLGALRAWFDLTWAPDVDDMRDLPIRPPVACGPVSLGALRDEFAALAAGSELFLDVQSGEMVSFSPEEIEALDRDDPARAGLTAEALAEVRRLYESESLIGLPSPSEASTIGMMEAFAESTRAPAVRNRLLNALESKKPARRFLDTLDVSGLRKHWIAFRDQAVSEAIQETLDFYGVPYFGAPEREEPAPKPRR